MSNVVLVGVGKKNVISSITENKEGITLVGQEKYVDEYITWDKSENLAKATKEEIRKILDAEAVVARLKAERQGIFSKGVFARGKVGTVKYTFKNSIKAIPVANEEILTSKLGNTVFSSLFTKKATVKIKKGMEGELVKALGDKAKMFLDMDTAIVAQEDFMEKRFQLRADLPEETNDNLDEIISEIADKPALSCK